jgi:hypothetical protein
MIRMIRRVLPKDGLMAFGEGLLTLLWKKCEDLGITVDIEVLLPAGNGAAACSMDVHLRSLPAQINRRSQQVIRLKRRGCGIAASGNCNGGSREPPGSYSAIPEEGLWRDGQQHLRFRPIGGKSMRRFGPIEPDKLFARGRSSLPRR